jgi:FeS assembly protein IscX
MGERELYWDATYEIVLALMEIHGDVDPEQVGVEQLRKMIVALPGFADDPLMVTEIMRFCGSGTRRSQTNGIQPARVEHYSIPCSC